MKKTIFRMILAHVLLAVLVVVVCLAPQAKTPEGRYSFLTAIAVIEGLFLLSIFKQKRKGEIGTGAFDIIMLVWVLLLIWEVVVNVLRMAHPVLVPAPENVFDTFRLRWKDMLINIGYSMQLLIFGTMLGLALAVFLGLFCGWNKRLKAFAAPIAHVMAPIPAVVLSPYLVAIMPTFRSASALVVLIGVFWPQFIATINRVSSVEPQILDSARMLGLSQSAMLFKVLLPYLLPGTLMGLRVTLTTSVLMLNFAELMGASHGMGYFIMNSITYANYTHAVAGILVIGIVVTLLNMLVGMIQKKFIKWH
ncbi:MAG: ABC transporter permease subunit [Lachnospiraceae bacterium]|nr:ABC transporter permease subunit [Lachnospiraceae bacterium]